MPPCRCCTVRATRSPAQAAHHLAVWTAAAAGRPVSRRHSGVPERHRHRLGVDMAVGGLVRGGLEGRQRHPELVSLRQVLRRPTDRLLAHPELERGQARPTARRSSQSSAVLRRAGRQPLARALRRARGRPSGRGRCARRRCARHGADRSRPGTARPRPTRCCAGTITASARWPQGTDVACAGQLPRPIPAGGAYGRRVRAGRGRGSPERR